jgi:hypothetical protein
LKIEISGAAPHLLAQHLREADPFVRAPIRKSSVEENSGDTRGMRGSIPDTITGS